MADAHHHRDERHTHEEGHRHSHTHGVVDPSIAGTERGLWALKWSFLGLAATALVQVVIVALSGSVALLADTIHNFADAATAIPLWIAFALARRRPGRRFPFGYGRVEDLAGVAIVLTILASALVAGYESVAGLVAPRPVEHLGAVAAASIVGFAATKPWRSSGSGSGVRSAVPRSWPTGTTPGSTA